jgi:hypothetical protein
MMDDRKGANNMNTIPSFKLPVKIPLLKQITKNIVILNADTYTASSDKYSYLNGKDGYKVLLPTKVERFLFKDIIEELANRLVNNKINVLDMEPLEKTFHKLMKDVVFVNDIPIYPNIYTFETYYLATAVWWIRYFSIGKQG